ncbi:Zinc carboxypeptidase domain protein [hydrothermal vent metagenome]|uniref:Zinc carboxypeptidase domain protein n=1 Tax=hydrothermal vent metagenome TaxID=652676 RepID=A0A3B0RH88_9ZZZZ
MVQISAGFDSGNIKVLDDNDPDRIRLEINKDHNSDFYQWFHFRLSGAKDINCQMHIENAGGSAYVAGWKNYQAVASYDRQFWFRVDTDFDGQNLSIQLQPEYDTVWLAYFAPFSHEQHQNLLAEVQAAEQVELHRLGETLDGRDLDLLQFHCTGKTAAKKLWLIARQHPGESMAEWWMEGFLARLVDETDPVAREIRAKADVFVVPNMNPDGSFRGHLRTNAAGANLNREWEAPTMQRSPEVFLVREKMRQTGMDFCLDVHGDEALPYNFIAGAQGTKGWSEARAAQLKNFTETLARISPDFQTKIGYPVSPPGTANLSMCTNWTAEEFGCLSMTLEMPFKDTQDSPDNDQGWSPERCRHLGAAMVDAIWARFSDL